MKKIEIYKEIPLEQIDPSTVNAYKANVQSDYTKNTEWQSVERLAKSLRGITPQYEQMRNAYLAPKYPIADLEKERIEAVRELQDYGIQVSKTMTHAEIVQAYKAAKIRPTDSSNIQFTIDRLKALEVATGVKTQEKNKLLELANAKANTIANWTFLASKEYYLTWYAPLNMAFVYSSHNGKEYIRIICVRNEPAKAQGIDACKMFDSTSKAVVKGEYDKVLKAQPSWVELVQAYDLQMPQVENGYAYINEAKYSFDFTNANVLFQN